MKSVAVAWCTFQPRTMVLASEFQGQAAFVRTDWARRHPALIPLRYALNFTKTWHLLQASDPEFVFVVTPPFPAPLAVWLWCTVRRRPFVVDCHTETFHSRKWGWAAPLQWPMFRRARAVLVHTEEAEALVRSWGLPGLLLPDDLPVPGAGTAPPSALPHRVVVAGGLDSGEPVAEVLKAAALLPDVEIRLTGDSRRVDGQLRQSATPNVVFTGWLGYAEFLAELQQADVVAAFSRDPHIMNRAAFEAVGLGRPLVLSDLPLLRVRFGQAALFTPNEPANIATILRQALDRQPSLAERSAWLAPRLRHQHDSAVRRLGEMLGERSAA